MTTTTVATAREMILAALPADRLGEWTQERVVELTGLHRADACQLLLDLAAEGHLVGGFQLYRPAPSPGLRQLLGWPTGPRRFDAMKDAASWLNTPGRPNVIGNVHRERPMTPAELHSGIVKATSSDGLHGIHACINVILWFPKHILPGLLPFIYRARPNVAGWQLLLLSVWSNDGSSLVIEAAGDRETLLNWFKWADYRNVRIPSFRELVSLDVPDDITLYRGGQGSIDELAKGWSWTTDRAMAAFFAARVVRAGDPVIIRKVAGNSAGVVMRRHAGEFEVTIDPLADSGTAVVVDTTDANEIAELKAPVEVKLQETMRLREAGYLQSLLAMPCLDTAIGDANTTGRGTVTPKPQ